MKMKDVFSNFMNSNIFILFRIICLIINNGYIYSNEIELLILSEIVIRNSYLVGDINLNSLEA